jgi:tRNA-splicing ligase RtcB
MIKDKFVKINNYLREIPKTYRDDMRVPARIYVSDKIWEYIEDEALIQLVNSTTLPGIVKYAIAMPDIHTGYGPPIGGVGAMKLPDGVISPGFVGYDENCGIRILKSEHSEKEISHYLDKLAIEMQKEVPSGLGRGRQTKLSIEQINRILEGGVPHLVKQGYGEEEDIENCEEKGKMEQADANYVSQKAKIRGRDQVGTLGSGNHFVSLEKIDEIYDEKVAEIFGLFKDQVVVMIHTGSRGLGHQNCTDYLRIVMKALPKYIREVWKRILGEKANLKLLYDVAHNIAKIEEHEVDSKKVKLIVHRKGATRAFPPNHPEIPEKYKDVGQPVIVPGSMGTSSYIMNGTKESKEAWHTVCHGAGRMMSRHAAMRAISGQEVVKNLEQKGILIKCRSMRGIAEEAPQAYKDIDEIVEVVHQAGLSKRVARLKPLAVIKGE